MMTHLQHHFLHISHCKKTKHPTYANKKPPYYSTLKLHIRNKTKYIRQNTCFSTTELLVSKASNKSDTDSFHDSNA